DDSVATNSPTVSGGNLTFTSPVHPKDAQATGTISASIPAGTSYSIRSDYYEKSDSKWFYCFGNKFTITSASDSGSTAAVASATTSTVKTSGAPTIKAAVAFVAGIVAAVVL
ncbi:hypothetical protein HDU82_005921, partial [Entophlyctis luteolus]